MTSANLLSATAGHRQPGYKLTLGGVDITPRFNGRLISLTLTDSRDGTSDQLDITLSDHDGRTPIPENGKTLSLVLGWMGDLVEKGEYVINEVQISGAPDTITVRARAVDTTATLLGQTTKSWHKTTIGEIVKTIAANHSLTPACSQKFESIRINHIDQTSESDLNFLNRIGQRYDGVATIKAGRLLFVERGQSTTANSKTLPTIILRPQDGDRYSYTRTVSDSYGGVKAHYNEKSGAQLKYVIAGSGDNVRELKATYSTRDDAANAAESEWQRIQRGVAGFNFSLAEGRADILVESPIQAVGFKPVINDTRWVATEVTHRLDSSGYRTEVRCEVIKN